MRSLRDYEQSSFWLRLDELSRSIDVDRAAVTHLISSVQTIAEHASWISAQVCRFMPQYTLHEDRHFLNVLSIMEALIPDNVLQRMTPLECALPLLTAYTHDMGMALSTEEHDALLDESTDQGKHFASYRERFDEEIRQLRRWQHRVDNLKTKNNDESQRETAQAKKRIDVIEGHILASYLRDTHTEDETYGRLRDWLRKIRDDSGDHRLYEYGQTNYERILALIGLSHGKGAPWLRRKLNEDSGRDDGFNRLVGANEEANLAFPGLLLRLADIMDFDASRAPRILFKHFGIENETSVLEWNKHLSIVGWKLGIDPKGHDLPMLRYEAECVHPVHEKSIREFGTWIDAELGAVRTELEAQRRQLASSSRYYEAKLPDGENDQRECYDLHLPATTDIIVRAVLDPETDQPKYIYHDLQFRLDQDEIQQLLMGESLYGDPGLCIRELLQNALDALELRELRLKMKKMKQKGEAREPVDGELIRPGWVREPDGREEELRVTLDWGTDQETAQQWLRVTDNGVGMTEEVIKSYFTQIGKSYYRSPEFNLEQAAMKAAGELVSPISIFGIGILSCFMIAERIQVRTYTACGSGKSFDVTISGPGSLFWVQPGNTRSSGTEVTLFLKSGLQISHDAEELKPRLRNYFEYPVFEKKVQHKCDRRIVDPVFVAGTSLIWPRYPVIIETGNNDCVRMDEWFHPAVVAPLLNSHVKSFADDFEYPQDAYCDARWETWDWADDNHEDATGSRIRVFVPVAAEIKDTPSLQADPSRSRMLCRLDELAVFVEPQLENPHHRTRLLVQGMYIEDSSIWHQFVELLPSVGARMWIDLRGQAAPRLTADRRRMLVPENADTWISQIERICSRYINYVSEELRDRDLFVARSTLSLFCYDASKIRMHEWQPSNLWDFVANCVASWKGTATESPLNFCYQRFLQAAAVNDGSPSFLAGDKVDFLFTVLNRESVRQLLGLSESVHDLCVEMSQTAAQRIFDKSLDLAVHIHEHRAFATQFADMDTSIQASILQEAFAPDLESSWPALGLFTAKGRISEARVAAPGIVEFVFRSDGRTVQFSDSQGETPSELVQRGYDLTFPMTSVPLGQLRRECTNWRTNRWYRPLGVTPFLLPALHDVWLQHAELLQKTFNVPHIYCLLPRFESWSKRFSDWTDDDWSHPKNLSALWDLSGQLTGTPGQALWARGTHDINTLPRIGLAAPAFLESANP